jgi:hypothetical protein
MENGGYSSGLSPSEGQFATTWDLNLCIEQVRSYYC